MKLGKLGRLPLPPAFGATQTGDDIELLHPTTGRTRFENVSATLTVPHEHIAAYAWQIWRDAGGDVEDVPLPRGWECELIEVQASERKTTLFDFHREGEPSIVVDNFAVGLADVLACAARQRRNLLEVLAGLTLLLLLFALGLFGLRQVLFAAFSRASTSVQSLDGGTE